MKQPWEWTEDDILSLIPEKVQESVTLEYKATGALARTEAVQKEIAKDVSAFANSAGGVTGENLARSRRLCSLHPTEPSRAPYGRRQSLLQAIQLLVRPHGGV